MSCRYTSLLSRVIQLLFVLSILSRVWCAASSSKSYYKILGIDKDADENAIKRAYRKLAMKHHPDKGGNAEEFKKIGEAYETLSNPKKREMYDLYGESDPRGVGGGGQGGGYQYGRGQGFPGGFPGGFSGGFPGGSQSFHFSESFGSGGFDGFEFQSSGNMADVLNEMFGQLFSNQPGMSRGAQQYQQKQYKPIEKTIGCTLEELYTGTLRKFRIRDEIVSPDGFRRIPIQREVVVDIQAGWKAGTRVSFNPTRDFPKKIIFTISEIPHKFFKREGDDIVWTCTLKQSQVDAGVLIRIPLLSSSTVKPKLTFNSNEISNLKTGSKKIFKGYGMPRKKSQRKQFGDLIVKFVVQGS